MPTGTKTKDAHSADTYAVIVESQAAILERVARLYRGSILLSAACAIAWLPTAILLETTFFRPAMPGTIKGVGKVAKWGRTIAFTEGELHDADGRLLAKATGTAVPTPFQTYKT